MKAVSAGAAALAAPGILGAEDKAGAKALVVGKGEHTYEVIANWARLPAGRRFGYTHGVCEDAQGRIFIHHQNPEGDSVYIFDPDGKFISSWGAEYRGGAHGMQLAREGNQEFLYLAPTGQHFVCKTDLKGEVLWKLGYPKDARNAAGQPCYADEGRYVPTNIAIAPNGDFYVADGYGSNYVHQYNSKAEYIRTFGGSGNAAGQLSQPHGIWCDTRSGEPKIVVADRANNRLQYFTLDGKHTGFVTAELRKPCHFDQRQGDLLIPDLDCRVTIFDKDNKLICHLGENLEALSTPGYPNIAHEKRLPGKFISPHQAIWDSKGNIYLVEWVSDGRVTKLRRV